jgi:hypothetical protein
MNTTIDSIEGVHISTERCATQRKGTKINWYIPKAIGVAARRQRNSAP